MISDTIRRRPLEPGEPAPWFSAPTIGGPDEWAFNAAGGRICLTLFYGSAANADARAAIDAVLKRRGMFDDQGASFFGVSMDPSDKSQNRVGQSLPGIRHFLDLDGAVGKLFGAYAGVSNGVVQYQPHFVLLDRTMRTIGCFRITEPQVALDATARAIADAGPDWAPVLTVPRLFDPELCRRLIALYDAAGGVPSGFVRDVGGQTTLVIDPAFKRRTDHEIVDAGTIQILQQRLSACLVPAIRRTFQFDATRIERYIVACYDAADQGFFQAHRDNTTRGTAHRRFAVTINLNDDYDGGDLRFPEFGTRTYRAPVGGAVVFSCSLLHEAIPVTRGRRYAYLPFLYDEAAAKIREENSRFLAGNLPVYTKVED